MFAGDHFDFGNFERGVSLAAQTNFTAADGTREDAVRVGLGDDGDKLEIVRIGDDPEIAAAQEPAVDGVFNVGGDPGSVLRRADNKFGAIIFEAGDVLL